MGRKVPVFRIRIRIQEGKKLTNKKDFFIIFHVLKCWMFSFEAGGFFCTLGVLYGGLGISKLKFLIKFIFSAVIFFNFWSSKPWIQIGIQPKMLDPDPHQMNTNPTHCPTSTWPGMRYHTKKKTKRQMSILKT